MYCYSCLKENGKKLNYFSYIASKKNEDCEMVLKLVMDKIDMNKINSLIDDIECMSDVRKKFYKNILNKRFEVLKNIA